MTARHPSGKPTALPKPVLWALKPHRMVRPAVDGMANAHLIAGCLLLIGCLLLFLGFVLGRL